MSHLFFIDESGHDRRQMPYEVHGGVAVPMNRAWELIGQINSSQQRLFGTTFREVGVEWKGDTLLRHRNFRFAAQSGAPFSETQRRQYVYSFLNKGRQERESHAGNQPLRLRRTADEFRAYGQACVDHADEVFQACVMCDATLLAAVVDRGAPRPPVGEWQEMLRKDFVFLFERLFYLMEMRPRGAMAAVVFDAIDDLSSPRCIEGERLNRLIARYFTRAHTGRVRSARIVPEPFYVRSDLTTLMAVSDLAIYVVNHVFRPAADWTQPVRDDLRPFVDWIYRLQKLLEREDGTQMWSVFHLDDLRPRGA